MYLALSIASLLRVGWQGRLSSLSFPSVTGTVDICPCGGLIRCSSFVYLLVNFHLLEDLIGILVGLPF